MSSEDAGSVIKYWLSAHPNARAIPITASPFLKSRLMIYIAVEDGEENLNVALVQAGAFPGRVMIDTVDYFRSNLMGQNEQEAPHRILSEERYRAYLKRVSSAEAAAKRSGRGIWGDNYKEMRERERME